MSKKIKKICCCVLSRANYGSIKSLMEKIQADKKFQLQLVVGSSALIDKQGKCIELIKNCLERIPKFLVTTNNFSFVQPNFSAKYIELCFHSIYSL